jgi:uncharacterized membrane protein (UPF0127 family)
LAVGAAAVLAGGCSNGTSSGDAAEETSVGSAAGIDGFDTVRVLVRTPEGELQWCMLLAATEAQRERGLMEVTEPGLNGYDGMLFRFPADQTGAFWMRNTPMPLSIAYLDGDGALVSSTDMAPCEDSPDCPPYPADGPFRLAVETAQGGLDELGIGTGATVVDTEASC